MSETGQLETFKLFINGKSVDALSGKTFDSLNPYTGEPWARLADGGPADVDLAVEAARAAFDGSWGAMSGFDRAAIMRKIATAITDNAERLALLEVRDSGKLMREMLGQLNVLGTWYAYFSGLADKLEGRTVPAVAPRTYFGYTTREPVGVVGAITPWNSPLLLLTMKLAPLLAAGCTCVVKPSEHSPASTVAFAEILTEAGLPPGVLNVVTGWERATGEALAAHRGIDKVAFTGSTATGVKVAQAAIANVNKITLELGGKSPQVVFPDADLDAAANGLVAGVFAATGQTCMAGSRLIVHESVKDAYTFTDEDQAIALANDTPYGLAGAVWTKDVHRAHRVAGAIRAGTVWINAYRVVTPNMPFGGFGLSGIGRENGVRAVDEYLEEKSVIVELTGGTRDPFTVG